MHNLALPRTHLKRGIRSTLVPSMISNITGMILRLALPPLESIHLDIVVSLDSPHLQEVKRLVDSRPYSTIHNSLPSLSGVIFRSDLAIGAAGSTTWERACLRLPSILLDTASNQTEL